MFERLTFGLPDLFLEGQVFTSDIFLHFFLWLTLKWQVPRNQQINDNTDRPNIAFLIMASSDNLRCHEIIAANLSLAHTNLSRLFKVYQLYCREIRLIFYEFWLKNYSFGLDVSMHDSPVMEVVQCLENFPYQFWKLSFSDDLILPSQTHNVVTLNILPDHIVKSLFQENIIQVVNVRMVQFF